MMNLSDQQLVAVDKIMSWFKTKEKRFVLAGYAGAGKTTMAKYIAEKIGADNVIFCAFTGKAANVLREKGCARAGTVHGYLYCPVDKKNDDRGPAPGDQSFNARMERKQPHFVLNEDSDFIRAKLIIVDEYSMLPEKIINDIEKLSKKVLYLGDPFQLPPVQGECSLRPHHFIEEIHRQALDSPIIRYANDVRMGNALNFCEHESFIYQTKNKIPPEAYMNADQIIVGLNLTRLGFNKRFREIKGFSGSKIPMKGEKIICLKNNREAGLFNGMIGPAIEVEDHDEDVYFLDFEEQAKIKVWKGDIEGRSHEFDYRKDWFKDMNRFDFAYAITCHKSQGSEFDDVLIYKQPIGNDAVEKRRWMYTALTRAKKKVTLVEL